MIETKLPTWDVATQWWDGQTTKQRRAAMDRYLETLAADGERPCSPDWQSDDMFWCGKTTAEVRERFSAPNVLRDIRACAALHIDFNPDAEVEQTLAQRLHDYNDFKRNNSAIVRALNADGRPGSLGEARLWHTFRQAWDMGARASQRQGS
jgi:hypothetical protein